MWKVSTSNFYATLLGICFTFECPFNTSEKLLISNVNSRVENSYLLKVDEFKFYATSRDYI